MHVKVEGTTLFVDVEGTRLRQRPDGWVEVPVVVVLHGGPGFDQGYLRPGLGPLAAWAQLIYVDLRGQGRSHRPPIETCTLEQMADDVAALCEVLGVEAPVVFGHSAGGFVALEIALRHPDAVGGLLLCDTAPTLAPLDDEDPPAGLAQRAGPRELAIADRMFGGDFSAASVDAFGREVAPFYAAPGHEVIAGKLMALSRFSGDVARFFFTELAADYDVRSRLGEIDVPTQVIVGAHDWVCPPIASRVLADGIPGAELAVIDDAGHFPFSEAPEPFLGVARRLLGDGTAAR